MVNSEFARLSDGLRRTRLALRDVIVSKLKTKFVNPDDDLAWWKQGVQPHFDVDFLERLRKTFNKQRKGGVIAGASDDPANLLEFNELRTLVGEHWAWMFADKPKLVKDDVLESLRFLKEARNEVSHANTDFSAGDVTKALGVAVKLLEDFGASTDVGAVRALRDGVVETPKGLPVWWQVARPHRDIREGTFDENAFAAKLDDVVANKADTEYQDPVYFFDKTYFTRNLRDLLTDTLKRLTGKGGQAVTQLRTPFGGGKTHALISLYHLIWNAAKCSKQPDIADVLREAGLNAPPEVHTVVLVGTALDPLGRTEGDVTVRTLWGELGYQIAGVEGYKHFAEHDELRLAPGKDRLRAFFERFGSTLILLDELLVYQTKVGGVRAGDSSLRAQTFAFLQELSEVVGGTPGLALVTTFPQSHLEYYDHADAPVVFETLEKIFGRLETVRVPVQGDDVYEVVRRRLFENVGDQTELDRVIGAYWEEYQRHSSDLPSEVKNPAYRERMRKAYPFHPALIDALQERWGSLQSFQRTRGVLRLLARVAAQFYGTSFAGPLIGPASLSLYDDRVRYSVVDIIGEQFDAVIASDLAEPGERARGVDRERGGLHLSKRLAEGAANTIFLYSHSGGGALGASVRDLTLALLEPDVSPALVTDTLERLKNRLYYIHADGELVSFKAQPNLNRVLEDRKAMVTAGRVSEALRDEAKRLASSKGNVKVIPWPEGYQEIPDNRDVKIVLLGPDHVDGAPETNRFINATIDATTGARRQYPNTVIFLIPQGSSFQVAGDYAKELMAIRDLESEKTLYGVLSDAQRSEVATRKTRASQAIPNALRGAYVWLSKAYAEPNEPNKRVRWSKEVRAEIQSESDFVSAVLKVLEANQLYARRLDPALIPGSYWSIWPEAQVELGVMALRDFFAQLPHLPLLEGDAVLTDAIARGVSQGLFGLALKQGSEIIVHASKREGSAITIVDVEMSIARVLVRPGIIPAEEASPPTVVESATRGMTPPGASVPAKNIPPGKSYHSVRLTIPNLNDKQYANLVEVFFTLNDGNASNISLTIEARADHGELDKGLIDLNLPEVLSQYGIEAQTDW